MALKMGMMDFKKSLAETIVPSGDTQPSTHFQRDGELPCKVVITSTHALPHHPRGFPMVKALLMVGISHNSGYSSTNLRCTVSGVGASKNPMKLKRKHTSHTNILKSSSELYKSSKVRLQSALVCWPPPKCS